MYSLSTDYTTGYKRRPLWLSLADYQDHLLYPKRILYVAAPCQCQMALHYNEKDPRQFSVGEKIIVDSVMVNCYGAYVVTVIDGRQYHLPPRALASKPPTAPAT